MSCVISGRNTTCCRDLSDGQRLANQHAQSRHVTLSTTISIRQLRNISFRWPLAHRSSQVGCTQVRAKKKKKKIHDILPQIFCTQVRAKKKKKNSRCKHVRAARFCRTLCQFAQHSLSFRHANSSDHNLAWVWVTVHDSCHILLKENWKNWSWLNRKNK